MKRTQEEILARIKAIEPRDPLGFERNELCSYLDKEHIGPFMTDPKYAAEHEQVTDPKKEMINYVEFAWNKACDERGVSASRSMAYFAADLWMDGEEELAESMRQYEDYGKANILKVCAHIGFDIATLDGAEEEGED